MLLCGDLKIFEGSYKNGLFGEFQKWEFQIIFMFFNNNSWINSQFKYCSLIYMLIINTFLLKFLSDNLASIRLHFWHLEFFSDHRRFFWSGKTKKWGGFSNFLLDGQLVRNFLCYESCRKSPCGCFSYW